MSTYLNHSIHQHLHIPLRLFHQTLKSTWQSHYMYIDAMLQIHLHELVPCHHWMSHASEDHQMSFRIVSIIVGKPWIPVAQCTDSLIGGSIGDDFLNHL